MFADFLANLCFCNKPKNARPQNSQINLENLNDNISEDLNNSFTDSKLQMSQKIGHPGSNFCQTKTKDRESPKKSSFQHIPLLSIKKNTNSCTNNETTEQNRFTSIIEGRKNGNVLDISPKNREFFSNLDVMIRQSRLEREVSESDDDDEEDDDDE